MGGWPHSDREAGGRRSGGGRARNGNREIFSRSQRFPARKTRREQERVAWDKEPREEGRVGIRAGVGIDDKDTIPTGATPAPTAAASRVM